MASSRICDDWASTIRFIQHQDIPHTSAKIAQLQTLLATLETEGIPADQLTAVTDALAQAQQHQEDNWSQLQAFQEEYEAIGCPRL